MTAGQRTYHRAVRVFATVFVVLGTVLIARTVEHGGGLGSLGVLMGVLLVAIGAVRLWAARGVRGDGE